MVKELKYLRHNLKYTMTFVILISVIAFLVTSLVIFNSYFDQLFYQTTNENGNQITVSSTANSVDLLETYKSIEPNYQKIGDKLTTVYTSRLDINLANNSTESTSLISADVGLKRYLELKKFEVTKNVPELKDYQIIISSEFAENNKLNIGDQIAFTTQNSLVASWQIPTLEVVSIINAPTTSIYTSSKTLDLISGITGENLKLNLLIFSTDQKSTHQVLNFLEHNYNNANFTYSFTLNNELYDLVLVPLHQTITSLAYFFLLFGLLGVFIYILIYIRLMKRRRPEIKLYYYLGLRYYDVALIFLKESILVTSISLFLGSLLGLLYTSYYANTVSKRYDLLDLSNLNISEVLNTSYIPVLSYFIVMSCLLLLIHVIVYDFNLKKVKLDV